jgi:hypothetical protein
MSDIVKYIIKVVSSIGAKLTVEDISQLFSGNEKITDEAIISGISQLVSDKTGLGKEHVFPVITGMIEHYQIVNDPIRLENEVNLLIAQVVSGEVPTLLKVGERII